MKKEVILNYNINKFMLKVDLKTDILTFYTQNNMTKMNDVKDLIGSMFMY